MAYYKVRIEVWCDWNPAESNLDDTARSIGVGEAICTMCEVGAHRACGNPSGEFARRDYLNRTESPSAEPADYVATTGLED